MRDQMRPPYFPVTMDAMQAELRFLYLQGESMRVGDAEIRWKRMNHPGGSFAYKITENGKSVIYATDSEVTDREFQQREENRAFFESADVLIIDSQYTLEESFQQVRLRAYLVHDGREPCGRVEGEDPRAFPSRAAI